MYLQEVSNKMTADHSADCFRLNSLATG